jgi:hypothetical protein
MGRGSAPCCSSVRSIWEEMLIVSIGASSRTIYIGTAKLRHSLAFFTSNCLLLDKLSVLCRRQHSCSSNWQDILLSHARFVAQMLVPFSSLPHPKGIPLNSLFVSLVVGVHSFY